MRGDRFIDMFYIRFVQLSIDSLYTHPAFGPLGKTTCKDAIER